MEKEIRINVPEGYEIDKENSTFECIKFKPVGIPFGDDSKAKASGYYILPTAEIVHGYNIKINEFMCGWCFPTEVEAKSVLAAAKISQILEYDKRFGGKITDEEWKNNSTLKFVIYRDGNDVQVDYFSGWYCLLAFHTSEQRDLFLKCYHNLIKQYLMIK